jgi:fermentation-respiration switch protein FrsA (DUF1100 family)
MTALLFTIFAGWVVAVVALFVLQRTILYVPNRQPPDPVKLVAAGMEPVGATTDDGLTLNAWFRAPAAADGLIVVLFQGNGGHHGDRLPAVLPLLRDGYGALLASYRGYGGNPGQPSEDGFYRDARAWLDALARRGIPSERVVLWGESLGSGVATKIATERRTAGVVLSAPFTSAARRGQEVFWFLPVGLLLLDRFDNRSRIASIGAPLLIVHGENDTVVPAHHGHELLALAREPKRGVFLSGADHNDLLSFGLGEHVLNFVRGIETGKGT